MTDNRMSEPTEAQIERAAVAMQAESSGFFSTEAWRHLARVGLTAAGVAPQEPRQNETKSCPDLVSLDPEKVAEVIHAEDSGGVATGAWVNKPYSRVLARALCEAYTEGKLT